MRFLRTNTAVRLTVGPFFDKTDGITPETSITVTSCKLTLMVDDANVPTLVLDAAPTASGGANDMVHVTGDDAGFYDLELAAANVNYLGRAMLAITDAAVHCPVFHEFMILPAMVYDSLVLGTDVLQSDVTQYGGSAGTFSGGRPEVNTSHAAGTAWASGAITSGVFAADAITAAKLAADVTTELQSGLATAAALAVVDGIVDDILVDTAEIGAAGAGLTNINLPNQTMDIVGNITGNLSGSVGSVATGGIDAAALAADAVAEIADGVWDEVLTAGAHNVANSAGRRLRNLGAFVVEDGTAQAGAAATITLAAGASSSDSFYNLDVISIVDGTGAGQSRLIVAYNGTTKVASLYRDWVTNPDNTSVYVIEAATEILVRNSGIAQAGGANTITLATTASSVTDNYVGETVLILTGTGAEQTRVIVGYNGTTKVASVTDAWATNPDSTSVYAILPLGRAYVIDLDAASLAKINTQVDTALTDYDGPTQTELLAAHSTTDALITTVDMVVDAILVDTGTTLQAELDGIQADTEDIQSRLPAALTGAGNIKADALAINGSTTAAAKLALSALGIVSGAAEAGTLSTTAMTTDLSEATDDHYIGRVVIWTSGVLAGQASAISDYAGATGMLTYTAVTEAPSAADTFVIV
jgi:hypothetical protein